MNDGYSVKVEEAGYVAEHFNMHWHSFDVTIIETRGPFETREAAEAAIRAMRETARQQ